MPMRDEAPRPIRKPREKLKAPGGKSKATRASKWRAPVTITAAVVSRVPAHRAPGRGRHEPHARERGATVADGAVEERHVQHAHRRRHQGEVEVGERGPEVPEVLGEPDVAGGDLQRAAEDELPDEQEGGQPAPSLAPVALAQVDVAAPGPG